VELALGSYPGCTLTTPPGDATPYGVFTAEEIGQDAVAHLAFRPDGTSVPIPPPLHFGSPSPAAAEARSQGDDRKTVRVPLGTVVGSRSGDKGGDANLGVWARTPAGHAWLRDFLTVDRLRELLPEAKSLEIQRYELPNLLAVNFVLHDLLGPGVAGSTRFDPQGKALGEWLRARLVEVPEELL
jgi:hypothetical protein